MQTKIRRTFLKQCLQTTKAMACLPYLYGLSTMLFSRLSSASDNVNKESTSKNTANAIQNRLAQAQQTVASRQQESETILAPDTRQGFSLSTLAKTIEAFTKNTQQKSALILLNKTPDQMSDGRRANISISAKLPDVRKMVVLFSANPNITAAVYEFSSNMLPVLDIAIKMRQTGDLIVLVESQNKWYLAQKSIKVLLGGCG